MTRSWARRARTAMLVVVLSSTVATVLPADVKYIAFGDSITDGFGDSEGKGYPSRLRRILTKEGGETVKMVKSGVAGEDSSEALSRLPGVIRGGGDVLLLMEGTNDVVSISDGSVSVETVISNLDSLALTAQRAGLTPVHATIFPRAPGAMRDRGNALTQVLVREIRELAYDRSRKFVDIYEAFDPDVVPDAFVDYYYDGPDPVGHPNDAGYDRIARQFADVLLEVDTVPPVVGTFSPAPSIAEVLPGTEFRVPIIETVGAAGILQTDSTLLINGRPVGEQRGNRRKLELVFQNEDEIGCRVVLGVRSSDRSNPPNLMERTLALYELIGRTTFTGDVDFDCNITGQDLVSVAIGYGAQVGEERYERRLDLNKDDVIDDADVKLLSKNFGKSSL